MKITGDKNIFRIKGLNNAYKIALSAIALLATASCVILVKEINHQEHSSRIINISGRQRMLSQNIVKNILLLNDNNSQEIKDASLKELTKNFDSWSNAHLALQQGDASLGVPKPKLSLVNTEYFSEIDSYYTYIARLCQNELSGKSNNDEQLLNLEQLLMNEKRFLNLMDEITFQFDMEAKAEVVKLKRFEILFWGTTLLTLLTEALFIFKPIVSIANKNMAANTALNKELMLTLKKKEENDIKLAEERSNSIRQMIMAEEEERKRIATALHDSLVQIVLSFKMNLIKLNNNNLPGEESKSLHARLLQTVDMIADEIRTISYNLMPATLAEFGIASCIEQYILKVSDSSKAPIAFIQNNNNIRVEPIKEILVYRVCQELLNNAIKHADASEITVQLLYHDDSITLMVEDNGKGFDFENQQAKVSAIHAGSGLRNIKTRLESIDATISIDSAKQFGTTTIIQIPYSS